MNKNIARLLASGLFISITHIASAADGTFNGVFHKSGTAKAMPVGDDIVVLAFDEYGYITSDDNAGPFNNVSCRCVGTAKVTGGSGKANGQCVVVDPAGDQYAISWETTEFTPASRIVGRATFIGGTGKFKGITGGGPWESSTNEVRPIADGTYQGWSKLHFTYQMK